MKGGIKNSKINQIILKKCLILLLENLRKASYSLKLTHSDDIETGYRTKTKSFVRITT